LLFRVKHPGLLLCKRCRALAQSEVFGEHFKAGGEGARLDEARQPLGTLVGGSQSK
jgi:hypothetical protein